MNRPIFLRYCCIATGSALCLLGLTLAGFFNATGAPLAITLLIIAATVAIAAHAGRLHWYADSVAYGPIRGWKGGHAAHLERIRHDANLVFYAVALFQIVGMIGALLGYRQQTRSASLPDSQAAVHALTLGLGNGLTATLAGVVCSVIVWVMFLHLQHTVDKPS